MDTSRSRLTSRRHLAILVALILFALAATAGLWARSRTRDNWSDEEASGVASFIAEGYSFGTPHSAAVRSLIAGCAVDELRQQYPSPEDFYRNSPIAQESETVPFEQAGDFMTVLTCEYLVSP